MPYYHVCITQKSNRSRAEVRLDLTLDQLKQLFLEPYRKGRPIATGGKSIATDNIERIRITVTEADSASLRPIAEQKRRGIMTIPPIPVEWYIADMGKDVTDEFITGPPGHEVEEITTTTRQPHSTTSMRVFISHSNKDFEIAKPLIDLLQKALHLRSYEIRCTSVDGYRMLGGASNDEKLRAEVHDAELLIGLISPNSLGSAYVIFELGARWGAEKPMISLLASGVTPEHLEGPLASINALDSRVDGQVYQLLEDAAGYLQVTLDRTSSYAAEVGALVKLSSAGTTNMQQQASRPLYQQLSEEAKELLLQAAKSNAGKILRARNRDSLVIQAGGKSFAETGDKRSEARWNGALEELEQNGLIEALSYKRQVFNLTHAGFAMADALNESQKEIQTEAP